MTVSRKCYEIADLKVLAANKEGAEELVSEQLSDIQHDLEWEMDEQDDDPSVAAVDEWEEGNGGTDFDELIDDEE